MKRWMLLLLSPICILSILGVSDRRIEQTEFAAWLAHAGYAEGQTLILTPGASYRATEYYRENDNCLLVAIQVHRAGEMWAILPGLIGETSFHDGQLFDGTLRPMPASAVDFATGRIDRRLRREAGSAQARLVFGDAGCVAE